MTLSYRNDVSIALIVVYAPCFLVSVYLSFKHGLSRSSGWYFLIIFCLARILGSAMELATISSPTNASLYTGSAILQNVGLSPLLLATLGLLSRLIENINRTHHTLVNPGMLKLVELLVTVGLILAIVGGINASNDLQTTGIYKLGTLSKVGTILFIVAYALIVITVVLTTFSISHAADGEKRILLAVIISLPFLLIRLVYSICSTLLHDKSFNILTGNVTILLCVAFIEEFIVVIAYEVMGCSLSKQEKIEHVEGARMIPSSDSTDQQRQEQNYGGNGGDKRNVQEKENLALRVAKKTIIGRIVMSFIPQDGASDMEMRQQHGRRSRR